MSLITETAEFIFAEFATMDCEFLRTCKKFLTVTAYANVLQPAVSGYGLATEP